MGYDDRDDRRYDERPRRPSGDYPRQNSGARNSRPVDGSRTPSRPRAGDTPSRGMSPSRRDGPPPSRRDEYAPPSRRDEYAPPSRRDTPPPSRRDAPPPRRDDRDAMRRVRDGLSGMYDAVSREVRSMGRHDDRRAPPRDARSSGSPSRPRRDDYAPPRSGSGGYGSGGGYDDSGRYPRYDDDDDDSDQQRTPQRGMNPSGQNNANLTADASQKSQAMRLINRRKKVRMNPAVRGCLMTAGIFLVLFVVVGGGLGSGYAYAEYQQYANNIASLSINRLFQTTRIYDRNGQLLYQTYGKEDGRREYISYCQMPESIELATVDTEDSTFWTNAGVDPLGTLRSVTIDLSKHNNTTGASTITQQLVKLNVLSDSGKNYTRKLNEAILAVGVTQQFSKQKILEMYLNTIPYGYQNYGIEAAAHNYFHLQAHQVELASTDPFVIGYIKHYKDAGCTIPTGDTTIKMSAAYQLQPWQAMLLAGIPQAPSSWDIFNNSKSVVYDRMQPAVMHNVAKVGDDKKLFMIPDPSDTSTTPYLAKKLVLASNQAVADYTYKFISQSDKQGNNVNIFQDAFQDSSGQSATLAPHFVNYVINELSDKLPGGFNTFASLGWNIYTTLDYGDPNITTAELDETMWDINGVLAPDPSKIKDKAELAKVTKDIPRIGLEQYAEYVVHRDIDGPFPDYWYCANNANQGLVIKNLSIPNPFSGNNHGDCAVRGLNSDKNVHNAALSAIDPRNGDILAMVGSVDFNSTDVRIKGQNNVALSNQRSLGSSFKPIVYATAFQMGWNPGTIVRDQPTCFPSDASVDQTWTDKYLCPNNYLTHNYERQTWSGAQPVFEVLGNSLNTPAEMALSFVGTRTDFRSNLVNMAQRLGIDTLVPNNIGPSTALGAQGVPLLEETSAYATFANAGYRYPPRSVLTVTSPIGDAIFSGGTQLFKPEAIPTHGGYQAISPQAAYMVTSVLTNNNARVGDFGPNNPLQFFNRDVAAKTGTSQGVVDIVTMGYTPWLAVGVWAGNSDNSPMAQDIIGIDGAGYIFHDFMNFAITRLKMPGTGPSKYATPKEGGYFAVPKGMHQAIVSCHTGLAPYAGEDVTKECQPASYPVPLFMTPEFNGSCDNQKTCNHIADLLPKAGWFGLGWGSTKIQENFHFNGIDTTWIADGQDPLIP